MREKLEVIVLPFSASDSVVIPSGLIEHILPFAIPLASDFSHPAIVGSLIYKNEKVPVIDLNWFAHSGEAPDSRPRHIAMIACLTEQETFTHYAITTMNKRSLHEIYKDSLIDNIETTPADFFNSVSLPMIDNQQLYVLDLLELEKQLFNPAELKPSLTMPLYDN